MARGANGGGRRRGRAGSIDDEGVDEPRGADAAAERAKRLAAAEGRLRLMLQERAGEGSNAEAVEYVVSTIMAELEAAEDDADADNDDEGNEEAVGAQEEEGDDEEEGPGEGRGGGISGPEDVFGVLQAFVPEDMLEGDLGVEDEEDMEILVDKIWGVLLKAKAVRDPDAEDEGRAARGGCELCGREMPLTRHHLRPRSTHRKFLKQGMPQETLNICAAICRPCHSAVHRSHDNDTLGQSFHTVALLLADEKVARFVAWARKVRPSLRSHHEVHLRYRR